MFVDCVTIEVIAGDGGDGCCSFRRERYIPRGGPDGGDGGDGGSIILVAEAGVDSLAAVAHRKHWRADKGKHGEGSNRTGRSAKDQIIKVPVGTIVSDRTTDLVLKDLRQEGEQVTVAQGGRGGQGNVHFKTSTNRAPRQTTQGQLGERRQLLLELKVIADVGLIGMPNAGKSTLLSRLTRARPEIADYPFTTKHPNLGRVQVSLDRSFVIADIPGLIEGAASGSGLGHDFLRHIQRTGLLVHLVEPQPMDQSDPVENYDKIRHELTDYDTELGERPEITVVTKAELGNAEDIANAIREKYRCDPLVISAVTGQGLNRLTGAIATALDAHRGETLA